MNRRLFWGVGAAALAVMFVRCTSATPQDPSLTLSANPHSLVNDGVAASVITVTASDEMGASGTGTVHVVSAAGSLSAGQDVTLASGTGTVSFTCSAATDPLCTGGVKVTGTWMHAGMSVTATTTLSLHSADAGGTGGGGGGSGGGTGTGGTGTGGSGGSGGGSVVADSGYVVELTSPRSRLYIGVGDFIDFKTALHHTNDAGPVVPNADIDLTASLGGWTQPVDGGAAGTPTATVNTGAAGSAVYRFVDNGTQGMATLTATNAMTGASRSVVIEIATVQQVAWNGMTCKGTACTILGVKNSGSEIGQPSFRVTDSANRPVVGVPVTLSLVTPPAGTTWPTGTGPTTVFTDANGIATSTVTAGSTTGAFNIHAVVISGAVEADSPTIGVRGVKPSNLNFGLSCAKLNIPALACSGNCPAGVSMGCTVSLNDRFLKPVGTGTSVQLFVEAGSVPSQVNTTAFSATGTNTSEGQGAFTYATVQNGGSAPVDVDPLPALVQGVFPSRDLEPSTGSGLIRNPRDGLVTLVAYVNGEEAFFDDNQNGVRDGTERFIDQGEPLLDANDNGVWDPGEQFFDAPSPDGGAANGVWDAPNGVWDANTTVWTETRILWSSVPTGVILQSALPFSPATCPAGVPIASSVDVALGAPDFNLNQIIGGSTYSVAHVGSRGTVSILNGTVIDGYGFTLNRRTVDATNNNADCTTTTPRCVWKILFGAWSGGYTGAGAGSPTSIHFVAPAITDMGLCNADTVTVHVTGAGSTASRDILGSWQGK